MIRPIVFSDLDDTLFQTAHKMSAPPEAQRQVTVAKNGHHSYMTAAQDVMVTWLLATTRLIPVTARSQEALGRCRIVFTEPQICSNGAVVILPDGQLDHTWFDRTRSRVAPAATVMQEMLSFVETRTPPGVYRSWIVQEQDTGIYFCVKSNEQSDRLDELEAPLSQLAGSDFVRHRNGNNLSFTPNGISKQAAVLYVRDQLVSQEPAAEGVPVWGMGDSLTDLPFMSVCDMMVIPRTSQIDHALLAPAPGQETP